MGSRTLTLLLGACALALGVGARASVFLPVDFDTLARRADLIVRGTVQSSSSALTPDGKQVHTVTRIAVGRTLKGSAPVVVEVRTPGGSVGDFSQKISGAPEFTPGEEVIVFLRRHGDSGRRVPALAIGMPRGAASPEKRIHHSPSRRLKNASPSTSG